MKARTSIVARAMSTIDRLSRILLDQTLRHNLAVVRRRVNGRPLEPPNLTSIEPCIFTLSTGRVGTKTLAALGNLSKKLLAYHEPEPYLFALSMHAYRNVGDSRAESILVDAVYAARAARLSYSAQCDVGYLETSPHATFLAGTIKKIVPQAKFIHLVRSPQAVVRSGMRRNWYTGNRFDSTRTVPRADSIYAEAWPQFTPLQKNLWLWAETNRWIAEFCSSLPNDQTLQLKSEDIFAGKQKTLEEFYSFANVVLPRQQSIDRILRKQLNRQTRDNYEMVELNSDNAFGDELLSFAGRTAAAFQYTL